MQETPKNSSSKNPYITPAVPMVKENAPLGSGTITRILGSGGMASVYEIWNQQLEVYHAVKLMHPNYSIEALQRFQTEIKITAKLHHPNIIEIHGVGEWNGLPYIEMEKAEGLTLESLINERGALPVEVVISIGILITRALNYAHNHKYMLYNNTYNGIIHRDLKPGNIMISRHEYVKLMDFGIARPADASFHTVDGTVLGTLQYLSPEQLEGKTLDIRTDIYSLGACLYEAACGNFAFPEVNITRLLSDKAKNRYRPLNNYSRKFPDRFVKIVHQCMHHDRNIRPQSAAILGEELETLLKRITTAAPEEIIASYMEADPSKITVVPLHHISKRAVFSAVLLILIGVLGIAFTIKMSHNHHLTVSKKPSIEKSNDSTAADTLSQKPVIFSITESSQALKIIADVESSKSLPTNKRSPMELLYQKHSTRDLLQIMKNELNEGNYSKALMVYDSMPKTLSSTTPAIIVKIRVLTKQKNKSLQSFLEKVTVKEAEILLAKAHNAWKLGNITASEQFLNLAESAQREFISYEYLIQECYYLRALCATSKFDRNPDEQNWKNAIGAWYNIKKELRSQPSHEYFKAADNEIARIGAKFRSSAR
ncbi:MAG TPA: serine/threonine-protein kinase [Chitinispirillaceae bacterium]|nr:serine/threonine-protein kinase [Chitinispirillaceae bacterium]